MLKVQPAQIGKAKSAMRAAITGASLHETKGGCTYRHQGEPPSPADEDTSQTMN
jgi:hypothetical protein